MKFPLTLGAECGGRTVNVMRFAYQPDEKGFRKAFGKMFPKRKMKPSSWQGPPSAHAFQLADQADSAAPDTYDLGIFQADGGGIMAYHCASILEDDSAFCSAALLRLAAKGWSELRSVPFDTSTFDFAGRNIEAGPACRFMGGRNYQCPGNGQLSWWEFKNSKDAEAALRRQTRTTLQAKGVRVSHADTVACTLEESPTRCLVNTYDVTGVDARGLALPELVAVNAQAEVRGRHVGAVCSFYRDEDPTLCDEVLDLPDGFHLFLSPPSGLNPRPARFTDSSFFQTKERFAMEASFSKNHQSIGILGRLIGNPTFGIYSSMEPLGEYAIGPNDTSLGILASSFTGVSLATAAYDVWLADSEMNAFQKLLFLSPYALHPEIWLFPFSKVKPYLGYSFDLVYDEGFRPLLAGRSGVIFDFLKWYSLRIKVGYEYYRYESAPYESFQFSIGAGIGDIR